MVNVSLQEEFNPAMYQLVQNLTAPSGQCEYRGVGEPLGGFGTREAQVLFPGETGSTAVHQRGPATHHPLQETPPPLSTLQAIHPKKAPLIIPLFSVLTQGNWGKALALPSPPSLLPFLLPRLGETLPCSPVYVEPVQYETF